MMFWASQGYVCGVELSFLPLVLRNSEILTMCTMQNADEKAISRHYKRLSLVYHPDKIRPDPAKNETIEDLNERFVELTKAYKALTGNSAPYPEL